MPGGGGCGRLVRAVGPAGQGTGLQWRFVGPEEALALGLVDELVAPDDVYDAALVWAQRFLDALPAVLAGAKALIDGHLDADGQAQRYGDVLAPQRRVRLPSRRT